MRRPQFAYYEMYALLLSPLPSLPPSLPFITLSPTPEPLGMHVHKVYEALAIAKLFNNGDKSFASC